MQYVFVSLGGTALFILFDFIWFYFMGNFFKSEISSIARLTTAGEWDVLYVPALLVYALMGCGMTIFVYLNASSLLQALLLGALLGLVGYGLYDLTNLATLKSWTINFAIVDMLWGTLLCTSVSGIVYSVAKYFVA